ncbi:hypothetical protein EDB89DRAFT_1617094 [Lactarius sanguifluus]|nr:hypothetical protein EDB89DRAFT_1617094 [Lactarius sanguifluus]
MALLSYVSAVSHFRAALLQPVMSILRGGHRLHSTASREGLGKPEGAWIASLANTPARSRATARTDSAISKPCVFLPTTSRIWPSVTRIVTSTYLTRWRVYSQLTLLRCIF